ncbi:MAG: DMT family transporter [Fibrobacterota bacterium]
MQTATPGQQPLNTFDTLWIIFLVVLWAGNSVIVKIAVGGIPPFYAAFFRFGAALPFIAIYALRNNNDIRVSFRELAGIFIQSLIVVSQIFFFNYSSRYTTGGRISLFLFMYPLLVPVLGPLFIKEESFDKKKAAGMLISFTGILIALRGSFFSEDGASTLRGDIAAIISCLILAVNIVNNKRLVRTIDRWKVLFWQISFSVSFFMICGMIFESITLAAVPSESWAAVAYQAFAVSVICFMSWQHLIAIHNSSEVTVFFFATPLFGMLLGMIILGEPFDPYLLTAGITVGAGIYMVNRK